MGGDSEIIKLARYFNNFYFRYLNTVSKETVATPLTIKSNPIGLVTPPVSSVLLDSPLFTQHPNHIELKGSTKDLEQLLQSYRSKNIFSTLNGWRNEHFEVKQPGGYSGGGDGETLINIERSAACLLGVRQFGIHINGYVKGWEGIKGVWLQKRADNKPTWPGRMDNMVGGGLGTGTTPMETALKEAKEEAGISDALLRNLKPVGAVSFFFESERGLFPNTEFVFDLELPECFKPANNDGEVQSFSFLTMEEVLQLILRNNEFKTTSCPVTLDFLIRHGLISTENEPQFALLLELLHVPLTTFYTNLLNSNN